MANKKGPKAKKKIRRKKAPLRDLSRQELSEGQKNAVKGGGSTPQGGTIKAGWGS